MRKYLLLLFASLFIIPSALSEGPKDRNKMREDLQKFKIDFLAKEMRLSEKEKSDFVPLYKEYDNERRNAGAEVWKFEHDLSKKKDATDDDYKKLAELQQSARSKDNEIVKKYDDKFASILSAKQIYTMHKGEEKFFERMKEMRKHHHSKSKSSSAGPKDKNSNHSKRNPKPSNTPEPEFFSECE